MIKRQFDIVLDRQSTIPIYEQVAHALRAEISSGRLLPGRRLPTMRHLAAELGINLGTAAKAYDILRDSGLIKSIVGSGTHVADQGHAADNQASPVIDLFSNGAAAPGFLKNWSDTVAEIAADGFDSIRGYEPVPGTEALRTAGAVFLGHAGLSCQADEIIATNGVQHALFAALTASLSPGDTILADRIAFSGLIAVARLLRLELVTVNGDRAGILPSEIDDMAARTKAKALFLVPCLNNPTTITLDLERRQQIVEVARRHGMIIIEDDIYGPLLKDRPPPIAALYPENTYYITGVSKAISPSLRVGFAKAPVGNKHATEQMAAAVGATTLMANPLSSLVFTRWTMAGKISRLIEEQRSELTMRIQIAREEFAGLDVEMPAMSPHLWLPLPPQWHNEAFSERLGSQNVIVLGAAAFAVTPAETAAAVRISVSGCRSRNELRRGLGIVATILRQQPHLISLNV